MPAPLHFSFDSPSLLFIAFLLGLTAVLLGALRRARYSRLTTALFTAGLMLLILAAGRPFCLLRSEQRVAVMVDLSASTRAASWRDRDLLRRRVAQLLGDTPYTVEAFASENQPASLDGGGILGDLPSAQTIFNPLPDSAILLFSDGRFAPPADSPPIYTVRDPALESAADAAITRMQIAGNQVAIDIVNNGQPRQLALTGVTGPTTQLIDGDRSVLRSTAPGADQIIARLLPGDAWPENDAASIRISPPVATEQWWISRDGVAPADWRAIAPGDLPADPAAYLAPSVILLNNVSATELSDESQQRLQQYVRDLGGSLIIMGGDHAFASGSYDGSIIGELSPLASSPPRPATQWILLADFSGSMAATDASGTPNWRRAADAIVRVLPRLPPTDPVRVGQFSDSLRWWSDGKSASQAAALLLPPPDALPHGPTNLQPVLEAIAASPSSMPTELLLLTDADLLVDDPKALARQLQSANVHLHLLAIGNGRGLSQLQQIITATGGSFVTELSASQWAASIFRLLSAALPDRLSRQRVTVRSLSAAVADINVSLWNHTWLRPTATSLATADTAEGPQPIAATWQTGAGRVSAAAFSDDKTARALADRFPQPPRDPRLKVSWNPGPILHVNIDAVDGKAYLNNLNLSIEFWNPQAATSEPNSRHRIPQSAPGRYEYSAPSPAEYCIATVRLNDRIIDRIPLAGWYAPEFAGIGEDIAALNSLATDTGGKLISPSQTTPIQFNWPRRRYPLTSLFAACGAAFLGVGLTGWKLEGKSSPRRREVREVNK